MSTVPNHALRQLRAGKLAIGLGVAQARTVGIAQIAKTCGFDWLFIDGEHSSLDADTAAQIATASLAVGVTPVVRVAVSILAFRAQRDRTYVLITSAVLVLLLLSFVLGRAGA